MVDYLIIKPSSLGDIIHGLLVAQSLKEQQPGARIGWVVREIFSPLVEICPVVDEVILFRRREAMRGFPKTLREIRKRHYNVLLDMQGLARTGIMTLAANADLKIGRSDAREASGISYHKRILLPATGMDSHAVDILLQFLPALNLKAVLSEQPLPFRKIDLPEDLKAVEAAHPIVLFPETRREEKAWPYFASLTRLLHQLLPEVLVVWASVEALPDPEGVDLARFRNLTGRTSLDHLAMLIQSASLVVANDSGPMHLAAALHRPVMGIFGPTDPQRFGPYPLHEKKNCVIRAPDEALDRLTAEAVLQTMQEQVLITRAEGWPG